MQVRGAVFVGQNQDMAVEELELDGPGEGQVLVRYDASGVCHSDLSVVNGTLPLPPPSVLGHEGAGVIEAVGPGVTSVAVGDRVVASFVPACGRCWHCSRGEGNLCEQADFGGEIYRRPDGSRIAAGMGVGTFAEACVMSESRVVKVHTDLPGEQLALIGCGVTTGAGAVLNTARVAPGESVAVIGCGGVGQAAIQAARIAGASVIIAVDAVQTKLDVAAKLGATHGVLAGNGTDPVGEVKELTRGRGVDYAFEVIGRSDTLAQAMAMARRGGAAVAVGVPDMTATLAVAIADLVISERRLLGSLYGSAMVRAEFPRLVRFAETGQLDLDSMVSRVVGIDDINDTFRSMQAGEVIRSVIDY